MQNYDVEQVRLVPVITTPFRLLSLIIIVIFVVIIWINSD